jgi:signal transduction histidine kinase
MILEQTDALTEIAESFSNFAQTNQREGSCQDLLSILKSAISSYNEKNVEIMLENRTEQAEALVFVSRSQMMQVFNNLIKNAIQAQKPDQKQLISIILQNHGDKMWQIQFSDTGMGMTPQVQEKIFQPNFTTKTSGMGLGLAVVKQIITARGGNISFESTLGEGTTFWIMLPKYV